MYNLFPSHIEPLAIVLPQDLSRLPLSSTSRVELDLGPCGLQVRAPTTQGAQGGSRRIEGGGARAAAEVAGGGNRDAGLGLGDGRGFAMVAYVSAPSLRYDTRLPFPLRRL